MGEQKKWAAGRTLERVTHVVKSLLKHLHLAVEHLSQLSLDCRNFRCLQLPVRLRLRFKTRGPRIEDPAANTKKQTPVTHCVTTSI